MSLKIEKQAVEFRTRFGFASSEAIRLKSLLIKLNIITLFKPLSSSFSGMAIKVKDNRFILINSNQAIGHQNFSICHELYHLYIQDNFTPHHCMSGSFNSGDQIEYNADLFAAYLLMPKDGIMSLVPDDQLVKDKITLDTILKLENYFSCSRSALLNRLKEIGLISTKRVDEFKNRIIISAKERGYEDSLYKPGNKNLIIGDFGSLAKQLYDSDKISEGHYTELMSSIGFDIINNS